MWNLKKWTGLAAVALSVGCASTVDDVDTDVTTSTEELGTYFAAAGKADGLDVRKLADGRVVFYGAPARELAELGLVSPRTQTFSEDGVTYAQSPFAYCATSDEDAACVSYLPRSTASGDDFVFGGAGRTVDATKASDLALAMYHGGYDREAINGGVSLSKAGSALSCEVQGRTICTVSAHPTQTRLELSFDMLPELGDDYVYEGWLVVDGTPEPAGRFDATDAISFEFDEDLNDAAVYVLTIEPAENDDPGPSDVHILLGTFENGEANLMLDLGASVTAEALMDATGSYILAAPSAQDDTGAFDDKGIWFLDPTGPAPSLDLPVLGAGWAYEGWIVTADGPISTGRFTHPAGADSDAGGPAAGPGMTPPFPGQDFVNPPLSLPGNMVVITIEPEPDTSAAPFPLKPLAGMIEDAGVGVPQDVMPNGEAFPIGTATLR